MVLGGWVSLFSCGVFFLNFFRLGFSVCCMGLQFLLCVCYFSCLLGHVWQCVSSVGFCFISGGPGYLMC